MSKSLIPRKPLPVSAKSKAAARREEFAEKVAALRRATGKVERRVIPFRCAKTARPFTVIYERESPKHRFRVAAIETEEPGTNGKGGLFGGLSRAQAAQTFDAAEFDNSGRKCPWCGDGGSTVHCGECGETVCGGRIRTLPDGSQTFVCHDHCGNSGKIFDCDRMHGSQARLGSGNAKADLSAKARKTLSGGKNQKRLSGPPKGLLPWKK